MPTVDHERHATIRAQARTQFDRWARTYDRSRLNELVFFPSVRICMEEIRRWQQWTGRETYRLLDVGCGTGRLLRTLATDDAAEMLVGLDYSPEMVTRLVASIAGTDVERRIATVVGDAEHLPFADASFDVLTCCNSFHHYPHQAAVVAEFRRVLRPGGMLVLVDGFRDNVIGWVIFDVGVTFVERNVHHASWSEIRQMITAAGFDTLRQRKMNVLTPVLVNVAQREG